MEVQINILAVFLAAASSMVVGAIWYARSVFGNTWIKLAKPDMGKYKGREWLPMVVTFAVSLVTAYVLAHVTYVANQFFVHSFMQDALMTAFWLWLGLTAARMLTHEMFEGRDLRLIALNATHEFITIMVMGIIIGLFGV